MSQYYNISHLKLNLQEEKNVHKNDDTRGFLYTKPDSEQEQSKIIQPPTSAFAQVNTNKRELQHLRSEDNQKNNQHFNTMLKIKSGQNNIGQSLPLRAFSLYNEVPLEQYSPRIKQIAEKKALMASEISLPLRTKQSIIMSLDQKKMSSSIGDAEKNTANSSIEASNSKPSSRHLQSSEVNTSNIYPQSQFQKANINIQSSQQQQQQPTIQKDILESSEYVSSITSSTKQQQPLSWKQSILQSSAYDFQHVQVQSTFPPISETNTEHTVSIVQDMRQKNGQSSQSLQNSHQKQLQLQTQDSQQLPPQQRSQRLEENVQQNRLNQHFQTQNSQPRQQILRQENNLQYSPPQQPPIQQQSQPQSQIRLSSQQENNQYYPSHLPPQYRPQIQQQPPLQQFQQKPNTQSKQSSLQNLQFQQQQELESNQMYQQYNSQKVTKLDQMFLQSRQRQMYETQNMKQCEFQGCVKVIHPTQQNQRNILCELHEGIQQRRMQSSEGRVYIQNQLKQIQSVPYPKKHVGIEQTFGPNYQNNQYQSASAQGFQGQKYQFQNTTNNSRNFA